MPICGKRSPNPLVSRPAKSLDRCEVCRDALGHCYVGKELTGVCAYNVVGPSIQIIKDKRRPKSERYLVVVLLWGLTVNRAFAPAYFRSRRYALDRAFERAIHLTGGPIEPWCDGDYMAGPVPGHRTPILVVD